MYLLREGQVLILVPQHSRRQRDGVCDGVEFQIFKAVLLTLRHRAVLRPGDDSVRHLHRAVAAAYGAHRQRHAHRYGADGSRCRQLHRKAALYRSSRRRRRRAVKGCLEHRTHRHRREHRSAGSQLFYACLQLFPGAEQQLAGSRLLYPQRRRNLAYRLLIVIVQHHRRAAASGEGVYHSPQLLPGLGVDGVILREHHRLAELLDILHLLGVGAVPVVLHTLIVCYRI